jgi:hypothetical protein
LIPSKRSPLAGWLMRFRNGRTCVSLAAARSPVGRAERTGAPCTDFQALTPARVPGCSRAVSPQLAGCSLGISPSKVLPPAALPALPHGTPLTRLARTARRQHSAGTSGYQSATDWSDSDASIASHWRRDPDNLPRVLVPACSAQVRNADARGYVFTSPATRRYRPTRPGSAELSSMSIPTGALRDQPWALESSGDLPATG